MQQKSLFAQYQTFWSFGSQFALNYNCRAAAAVAKTLDDDAKI
jgi:hypothetical protein